MSTITYDQFEAVEIRTGRILRVEEFPKARNPSYKLWIDFGELGEKKSSAQLTTHYTPASLTGKLVLAVVNFPPRQIADFMSEVLLLGVPDGNGQVVLVSPQQEVPLGGRLY